MWSAGTPERPALFVLPQVAAPADARPATPPRASGCSLPERSFVTTKTVVVAAAALPRTRPTVSKSEARSPGGTARHAFWGPSPTASLLQVRVSDVFTPEPAMHVVETGGTVRNCQQRSGTIWHSEASRAVWAVVPDLSGVAGLSRPGVCIGPRSAVATPSTARRCIVAPSQPWQDSEADRSLLDGESHWIQLRASTWSCEVPVRVLAPRPRRSRSHSLSGTGFFSGAAAQRTPNTTEYLRRVAATKREHWLRSRSSVRSSSPNKGRRPRRHTKGGMGPISWVPQD